MNPPPFTSYKFVSITPSTGYYSWRGEEFELTITDCVGGFIVGMYNKFGYPIYPSITTNLKGIYTSLRAYKHALPLIKQLLDRYEQDQAKTNRGGTQ